jgi:hypothetical protein
MSRLMSTFKGLACLVVATAAAAAVTGIATASNVPLRFATVTHDTVPWKLAAPQQAWAQVVNRVIDAPGQGEEVDFHKYFGVYAFVMRPTSGYSLTLVRIQLQRLVGYRQICAAAAVHRPTGAVTQERSLSAHYVRIKRGRLGLNVPDHIVLRERRGGVLYATPGSRRDACRG